jgi:hypothetical protein
LKGGQLKGYPKPNSCLNINQLGIWANQKNIDQWENNENNKDIIWVNEMSRKRKER